MPNPQLVWFRQDLRLADQPALAAAAAAGPVIALYVLDDETPGERRMGAASRWWLHHSLASLDADLRARGGRLVLRRGRAGEVVPAVAREAGATAVHALAHCEPYFRTAEAEIAEALPLRRYGGITLAPPSKVLTESGTRFKVFTPYWNALQRLMPPPAPRPAPARIEFAGAGIASEELASWPLLPTKPDWATGFADWQPGEGGAQARLDAFTALAAAYAERRDFPSEPATSRLSPHLHFGEVSPAQVWHAHPDATAFLRELAWRDFAINLLDLYPDSHTANGRPAFDRMPWTGGDEAEAGLRAWQRGHTGYPLVDAGMRELWATGWMHNRLRMITASFLTKHLLIDWRAGERWFWACLVDADEASNALGWQWVAGSGVSSQPYNRIFSPHGQSERFEAAPYIRRWVPELAHLPDDAIHAPWEHGGARGYPQPVVEHGFARARALAAYESIRA